MRDTSDLVDTIVVTAHALKRCRKRLGIPLRGVRRHIETAYWRGVRPDVLPDCAADHLHQTALIYGNGIFIFHGCVCVTVYPVTTVRSTAAEQRVKHQSKQAHMQRRGMARRKRGERDATA